MHVSLLLHYLEKIDTTNTYSVLVPKKDEHYWKPTNKNFTVRVADFKNYSFSEQTKFKSFLEQLNPDLVHFCMPQQPVFYKGNSITTVHDLTLLNTYNSDKNWLVFHIKQLVGRYVFKKIAHSNFAIISPSEYTKKAYVAFSGIDEGRVYVTYEAADIVESSVQPYSHPFKRYILYVGQQSDYKNIKRLGDAHQKLLEKHPDLGLMLVGKKNASSEKNEEYFNKRGYKNIHFTDFIPNEQRDWLYKNAEAYVFPSLMEGFGLPGLEAMGYGAPVVSSNATCLPEVYGEAAYYFNPTDTDDIARAISDVLSDTTLRNTLIERGYKQLKKYSWERMARETRAIYMKALKSLLEQ
jgi:glycosyltransferase involved in cell wall biosynthesis